MGVVAYFVFTAIVYIFCWPIAVGAAIVSLAVMEQFGVKPELIYGIPSILGCMCIVHSLALNVCNFVTRWENRVAPEV